MDTTRRKPAPLQNAENQDIDNKVDPTTKTDPSRGVEVTPVENARPRPQAATSSDEQVISDPWVKSGRVAKVTPPDEQ